MAGSIKWKQSDYIKLGKAVSNFNKKIRKLNKEENKLYLPEIIDYKDIKGEILTRQELNKTINSLKRFQETGAEDLYITQAGEEMTKWERRELGIKSRIAQTRLKAELKSLNEPLSSGYSRAQMGSLRVKEIQAQIKNLKQIETKKGYEFTKLTQRINQASSTDFLYKKALTYQQNYLNELKKYSHLDNYDKLMTKLNSFKSPESFYEFMNKNELTKDLTYQSDQYYTQEAFNSFLEELGIEIEE